jgi:spermidine synthase
VGRDTAGGMSAGDSVGISGKLRAALLVLCFGSGCAALIYEVVWFQLLELVIGSTAISMGILLGVYMGGLCAGSLALPRCRFGKLAPLSVYALLECGIGGLGIGSLFLIPWVSQIYASHSGHGLAGLLSRGAICAACLFPSTVLMGATFPALARSLDTSTRGVSWLGLFYGANTVGAVVGCLVAGFYLLPFYDMRTATGVAVALNGITALGAFALVLLSRGTEARQAALAAVGPGTTDGRGERVVREADATEVGAAVASESTAKTAGFALSEAGNLGVYVSIGISGFCALGAEVVWTRILSLMLGGTVYTFSIILAVFLAGLGIGSAVGAYLSRISAQPSLALGSCQFLLCVAMAWAALLVSESLPYWPINPSLSRTPWLSFQVDAVRCALAILPAACLWGASFPLALAAAARGCMDPARLVGRVYAANTVGAVLGALTCSIVLVGWLGSRMVQQFLIGSAALGGLLVWLPGLVGSERGARRSTGRINLGRAMILLGVLVAVAFLGWRVPKLPWDLVAYGRSLPTRAEVGQRLFMGEGMNASVAVSELSSGVRSFHVAGKLEASTDTWDMRMQGMLGHLPGLLHSAPKSVLIVGCGAGVTAGTFVGYPSVKRIVICELEPLVPRVVAQFFRTENGGVLEDPRTEVIADDARHYLLTTHDTFDIITSDPIHPWVKGAATLYTQEYFKLCQRHLNSGGVVAQWVPLYESDRVVVQSELATFFDAFPQGTVWGNEGSSGGYDVVLLGRLADVKINVDEVQDRLSSPGYETVRDSLRQVGFRSAFALLSTYAGRAEDLRPWVQEAPINRDRDLRLSYLAGLGLNHYQQQGIYSEILQYRRFPENLFTGRPAQQQALQYLIDSTNEGK